MKTSRTTFDYQTAQGALDSWHAGTIEESSPPSQVLQAGILAALLAIAGRLDEVRDAITDVRACIDLATNEHSHFKWISTWLEDISKRPVP